MKKLYILIQLIALLICVPAAYAESSAEAQLLSLWEHISFDPAYRQQLLEAATNYANEALRSLNDNMDYFPKEAEGRGLNANTHFVYRLLAYGDPHGTFDLGHYRYHGYTREGEAYTNPLFRPDFTGFIDIDKANWLSEPEKNPEVDYFVTCIMKEKSLKRNNFDRQRPTHKYRYSIAGGLLLMHEILPGYYKVNKNTVYDRDWENYVHILQPPTKYTFGVGRMFRKLPDGSMRYLSVPLASGELVQLDLSATLKEEAYQGEVGSVIESTATFALYKDAVRPVTANLRLYMKTGGGETEIPFTPNPSKVVSGNQYTFQPGEKLEVKFYTEGY
ncbi:MAG: hypothetical protein K6T65_15805 [Peptococcaceae bacterium]|nr:hypothetical protein [Peptococcaceae bacterium]